MDVWYLEVCDPLLLPSFTWPDVGRVFLCCSEGQHLSRLVEEPQGIYYYQLMDVGMLPLFGYCE